ncbi:DUF4115 domain-containing protein [Stakelama sediminis]
MNENDADQEAGNSAHTIGERLRAGREREGLALDDIAERTRIPLRHLQAIENDDYSSLPAPTYALGFAKAYARAVGMDEVAIAHDLRNELDAGYERPAPSIAYEVPEPPRGPGRGVVFTGVAVAVLVLLGIALWYGTDWFRNSGQADTPVAEASPTPTPTPSPSAAVPQSGGQVVLTATGQVWVRIYDAQDKTLMMKTMSAGETYDVPQDADNPMINVGRPGMLKVTINGAAVAPLGPPERAIKDVPVSADALRARTTSPADNAG